MPTKKPQVANRVERQVPVNEATVPAPAPTTAKKKYADDDKIPCMSLTPGKYFYEGEKSKTVYKWADSGVTEDVRYDDLTAAIRNRKLCIFKPRIVIQDDEFVSGYSELKRLYDSLYSKDDLAKILTLEPNEMKRVIEQLPEGAKDAVKTLAMRQIDSGELDSVARVRMLDQIYGTDMLIRIAR